MRRFLSLLILAILLASSFAVSMPAQKPAEAYSNSNMIDDMVFDNSASMSTADIQNFLNQFPNSCLKSYSDAYPNDYFSYGSNVSAATVIRRVSDLWGINPQVMLTKLEQEENLVTGNAGCPLYRYVSAVGFNCPGPTRNAVYNGTPIVTCVQNDANMGFSRQVTKGAWLLKWGKERALGNLSWLVPDDANYYYGGPMTQGTFKRSASSPAVYYDGYWNGVHLDSGATASLYNYTPYLNQAFPSIFEGFFGVGSTTSCGRFSPDNVFRAYFPRTGEHFYTQSCTEWLSTTRSGAIAEGIAFRETTSPSSVPLYRLIIPNGKHYYTANLAEKNALVSTGLYRLEGVAYYVEPATKPNYSPVWQLRNDRNGDHFYTMNLAERDSLLQSGIWKLDGAAYFGY